MVWVVPIARATFDQCGAVLGRSATLPEALQRCAYRALGPRSVLMVRGVVLSGRWLTGGRARTSRDWMSLSTILILRVEA